MRLLEFLNDISFEKFVKPVVVPLNSYEKLPFVVAMGDGI
jgi:hypothetical protein